MFGRFLWVVFQIDSICSHKTDESILNALEHLPKDLPETLDRILQKLKYSDSDLTLSRRIFEIVAVAHRPLDLEELREAISIEPGTKILDTKNLVNDINSYLDCCGSLLIVDEEYSTVHYAHHSIKQYLLSQISNLNVRDYHIEPDKADMNFGEIIVTYLDLDVFKTQLTKKTSESHTQPISFQTASHMLQASLDRSALITAIASKYLRLKGNDRRDIHRQLEMASRIQPNSTEKGFQHYHFLAYAQRFWLHHTKLIGDSPQTIHNTWKRLLSSESGITELPWEPEHWLEVGPKFIEWVAQNDHLLLFRHVLDELARNPSVLELRKMQLLLEQSSKMDLEPEMEFKLMNTGLQTWISAPHEDTVLRFLLANDVDVNVRNTSGHTALCAAVVTANESNILLLLQKGADTNKCNDNGNTALFTAVETGNKSAIWLLLEYGADINIRNKLGHTVLQRAVLEGKEEILQILLENGVDVNAPCEADGRTALHEAATGGREIVVRLLLEYGADVNVHGGGYKTVLQTAVVYDHGNIIRLLLERGADINAQGGIYDTALQGAAACGFEDIVQLLIEEGADVNAHGGCALRAAAEAGKENMIQLLLEKGAMINARDGYHGTALQGAAEYGRDTTVKLLLGEGANINAHGGHFGNALQGAAACGQEAIVRLLIDTGADVNAQGGNYGTALQAAAACGRESVVRTLLERGADKNARCGRYHTALQAAAVFGHEVIVRILLEKGADVNLQGGLYDNALQGATANGRYEIQQILLDYGANTKTQGGHYQTTLQAPNLNPLTPIASNF